MHSILITNWWEIIIIYRSIATRNMIRRMRSAPDVCAGMDGYLEPYIDSDISITYLMNKGQLG